MLKKIVLLFVASFALLFHGCTPKVSSILNSGANFEELFYMEIPFTTINDKIIIEASINGQPKKFILDTGSPNVIKESLFLDLNENIVGEIRVEDILNQSKNLVICDVDRMEIGGTVFKNVPTAVVEDENPILGCFQVDGIIGSNMLRNTVLHLDKAHGAIILTNDVSRLDINLDAGMPLEIHAQYSAPMFYVKLNGQAKERVIFDTGIKSLLSMTNEHVEALEKYNVLTETQSAFGYVNKNGLHGNLSSRKYYQVKLNTLDAGLITFNNVVSTTLGAGETARLGSDYLNYAAVTLDFISERLYIRPTDKLDVDLMQKRWAVSPAFYDGRWRVGLVWNPDFLFLKDQEIIAKGAKELIQNYCISLTKNEPEYTENVMDLTTKDLNGKVKKTRLLAY